MNRRIGAFIAEMAAMSSSVQCALEVRLDEPAV